MKQPKRKKKRTVRQRDWADSHEDAFTHDLKRHRRTDTTVKTGPARAIPETFEPNGVVIEHTKKYAYVKSGGEELLCRIGEGLSTGKSTVLASGDAVLVERDDGGDPWVVAIAPRRTKLSRLAIEDSRVAEQVIAANVDAMLIVAAAKRPALKPGLIDRYLITAQVGGVEPVVCINKLDLVDDEPEILQNYRELGIAALGTSCDDGRGIDALRQRLTGKLSVVVGQSGVGKSSLLNALAPDLDLATREVSDATEKGKHTTTSARLYELEGGIRIIDTPGVRKLGVWGVSNEELAFYFPEFLDHAAQCRFRNCTHTHEPGCGVVAAVARGEIPPARYGSYLRIRASIDEQGPRYEQR